VWTIYVIQSQIRVRKFDCDCGKFKGFKSSSVERSLQGLQRRNAVPPPTFEESGS